jgi:hypothetical protein
VSSDIFHGILGHEQGSLSLKGVHPVCSGLSFRIFYQLLRLFAFELSAPLWTCTSSAAVAAMAFLDPPECLQFEVALNLVRNMLGWGAPAFAGRIRFGTSPLGNLAAGGLMFLVSNLPCGLALPILSFFVLLLEELGLQPQHFTPHFILQEAIVAYLCETSVGAMLLPPVPGRKGVVQRPSRGGNQAELWLHLFGFNGLNVASNGDRWSSGQYRRHRLEGRTRCRGNSGRALPARPY